MKKISKEELLKLAHISRLELDEQEIPDLMQQMQDVLSYAERVTEVVNSVIGEEPSSKNINVFREDVVDRTDAESILAQAPEREENFFVVPVIIDTK